MRIDLAAEGIHPRLEQQLLMLLEVHLDPRVIPDFNRHGHRHYRREHHQQHGPPVMGVNKKEPGRPYCTAEQQPSHFHRDAPG